MCHVQRWNNTHRTDPQSHRWWRAHIANHLHRHKSARVWAATWPRLRNQSCPNRRKCLPPRPHSCAETTRPPCEYQSQNPPRQNPSGNASRPIARRIAPLRMPNRSNPRPSTNGCTPCVAPTCPPAYQSQCGRGW